MLLKDYNEYEKPREKLKELGKDSLSDAELLAIILNTGTRNLNVLELSQNILKLINEEGGFDNITLNELTNLRGVGEVKASKVIALIELSKRLNAKKKHNLVITSPYEVYKYLVSKYDNITESLIILYFNKGGKFIMDKVYSNLSFNNLDIEVNELVKWGIKLSAYNIILAHNHPSGNPLPSVADIRTTKEVVKRFNAFELKVIDHIVFSTNSYVSMRDKYADIFDLPSEND